MMVLLDSNVWYSALTAAGNERALVRGLVLGRHTIVTTDYIRAEVLGVFKRKLAKEKSTEATRFFNVFTETLAVFVKNKEMYKEFIAEAKSYISETDVPILAAGLQEEVDAVVSGDKHFVKNPKLIFLRKKKIFTTKELLKRL